MRWGRTKRRLPDSLTRYLSDPKIVILKPANDRRPAYSASGATKRFAVSAVTLSIIVLAGGHLLRAW